MLCYFYLLKYFKIKYVIYETYNISFSIWKFYTNYTNHLNVIIINLYTFLIH
jgi:hypothetical protein